MERVRGHRYAGFGVLDSVPEEFQGPPGRRDRHYITAAALGAVAIGTTVYGIMSQPSGKPSTARKAAVAEAQRRQDEQYALQRMLQPFMLEQLGLEAEYGPGGSIANIKKRPPTALERQSEDIQRLASEKTLKYLRGEGDIDPAATRALDEDERQREEYLARALGPDWRMSSPGRGAVEEGRGSRRIAESAIRRGEGTAAEAVALGRMNAAQQNKALQLGLMRGVPGLTAPPAYQDLSGDDRLFTNQMARARGYTELGVGLMRGAAGVLGARLGAGGGGGSPDYPPPRASAPSPGAYWSQ